MTAGFWINLSRVLGKLGGQVMSSRPISKKQPGFTLIELMIVVSVLAIVSGVSVLVLRPKAIQTKAIDAARLATLHDLGTSLSAYFGAELSAPVDTDLDGTLLSELTNDAVVAAYLTVWPIDATYLYVNGRDYVDGESFCVSVIMASHAKYYKYLTASRSASSNNRCLNTVVKNCDQDCKNFDLAGCQSMDDSISCE